MTADVRFTIQEVTFIVFFTGADLLVRANDVSVVCLDHEQSLAQGTGTFAKDFVRRERNNRRQRKDERVHVLHVQVVRTHGIGNGIRRHHLRVTLSVR